MAHSSEDDGEGEKDHLSYLHRRISSEDARSFKTGIFFGIFDGDGRCDLEKKHNVDQTRIEKRRISIRKNLVVWD